MSEDADYDIAIVGMAGRFPGARDIDGFWQNLCDGVESVTFFSDDELRASGIADEAIRNPDYVKAAPVLEDPAAFDPRFFGFTPREAVLMDPQHRLLLELAWEAVENAGYDTQRIDGRVGVFASCAMNTYLLMSGILPNFVDDYLPTLIGNDKDFLATRISHRLGLTGPSMSVQTACSSSLVAAHLACQSLLSEECDMALAGAAAIRVPHVAGHTYATGSVFTPDGHCRPFDARANGTIFGSGGGMVLLKRLADAVADGDMITAVIKGSAVNNDGASKAEYTAPSIESQSEVVVEALANAGVSAEQVAYVETHGTGTYLGDPIEIAALTKAFRQTTEATGFCAVGSVKSNIGHLDAAAGVCSLIKTALALHHKRLPASINFDEPNPQIDFESSPFYVNTTLADWLGEASPAYAGVTSLGIGGTNAHVVLGPPPAPAERKEGRPWQLLPLSAPSETALGQAAERLAAHIDKTGSEADVADVAATLQNGRRAFQHRRITIAEHAGTAAEALLSATPGISRTGRVDGEHRDIVMMFSGQGAQHPGMAKGLYDRFDAFREQVDICAEILREPLDADIRTLMWPADPTASEPAARLAKTAFTQPALFVTEYALARLLIGWGIKPDLLVGHSIGEYVAACLAGVFSLEDALRLVAERGRLMQSMPEGAMLSVASPSAEIAPLLGETVEIACVNSTALTVLAGPEGAVADMAVTLEGRGLQVQRLRTSHAFHSAMMAPALDPFEEAVRAASPKAPEIPIVSNLTGKELTAGQACDPGYWSRHLRETVQFDTCLSTILSTSERVLIEIGPGRTLATFARQHQAKSKHLILTTMRQPNDSTADPAMLLDAVGRLWLNGIEPDWPALQDGQDGERRRVPLPTYPFQRQRMWPKAEDQKDAAPALTPALADQERREDGISFHTPLWRPSPALVDPAELSRQRRRWLIFSARSSLDGELIERLGKLDQDVTLVLPGTAFGADEQGYAINPKARDDYDALAADLDRRDCWPDVVVHLWAGSAAADPADGAVSDDELHAGFFSLAFLAGALGRQPRQTPIKLNAVTTHALGIDHDDVVSPARAMAMAPVKVMAQEYPHVQAALIDVQDDAFAAGHDIDVLVSDLASQHTGAVLAYRRGIRWAQDYARLPTLDHDDRKATPFRLRQGGVYLITGGLGRIGLALARYLATSCQAKLVLLGRSGLPPREQWQAANGDQQIEAVLALEKLGSDVLVVKADVANTDALRNAINVATERFGPLNGVIHAAGDIDLEGFCPLRDLSAERAQRHFLPKVHGLISLAKALDGQALDFCLLTSSISSVLGGLGFCAYAGANVFMDAFISAGNSRHRRDWLVVNWDAWASDRTPQQEAMTTEEGVASFETLMSLRGAPRLIVSKTDLNRRLAQWIYKDSGTAAPRPPDHDGGGDDVGSPAGTPTASPDHLPAAIEAIWRQVMGIDEIDPHDDFFELGGSSLMATQVAAHLRDVVKTEVAMQTLFEYPTIAELAEHLAALMGTEETADGNGDDAFEAGEL